MLGFRKIQSLGTIDSARLIDTEIQYMLSAGRHWFRLIQSNSVWPIEKEIKEWYARIKKNSATKSDRLIRLIGSEIQYSLSALLQWFRQTQHGTITVLAATNSDIFSQTDRPRNM